MPCRHDFCIGLSRLFLTSLGSLFFLFLIALSCPSFTILALIAGFKFAHLCAPRPFFFSSIFTRNVWSSSSSPKVNRESTVSSFAKLATQTPLRKYELFGIWNEYSCCSCMHNRQNVIAYVSFIVRQLSYYLRCTPGDILDLQNFAKSDVNVSVRSILRQLYIFLG